MCSILDVKYVNYFLDNKCGQQLYKQKQCKTFCGQQLYKQKQYTIVLSQPLSTEAVKFGTTLIVHRFHTTHATALQQSLVQLSYNNITRKFGTTLIQ
jgi:hypothetical protein